MELRCSWCLGEVHEPRSGPRVAPVSRGVGTLPGTVASYWRLKLCWACRNSILPLFKHDLGDLWGANVRYHAIEYFRSKTRSWNLTSMHPTG